MPAKAKNKDLTNYLRISQCPFLKGLFNAVSVEIDLIFANLHDHKSQAKLLNNLTSQSQFCAGENTQTTA